MKVNTTLIESSVLREIGGERRLAAWETWENIDIIDEPIIQGKGVKLLIPTIKYE